MNIEAAEVTMKRCAAEAVAYAALQGITLDFGEASLGLVDDLLDKIAGPQPSMPESSEKRERLLQYCRMFAGYIGEVAAKVIGGSWTYDEAGVAAGHVEPVLVVKHLRAYPMRKVWHQLTRSEFDGVGGYCRALRAILQEQAGKADRK